MLECFRDDNFSVSVVTQNDVIHANRKDLPCIFKICGTTTRAPSTNKHTVLCLCDSEEKCNKWVGALRELYSLLRKYNLLHPPVSFYFQIKFIRSVRKLFTMCNVNCFRYTVNVPGTRS